MLHCKDNVRDHVTKAGVQMAIRQELLKLLFGNQGLASASNKGEFDNRTASALQYIGQYCSATESYVSERIVPKMLNNCRIMWVALWLGKEHWTNNLNSVTQYCQSRVFVYLVVLCEARYAEHLAI